MNKTELINIIRKEAQKERLITSDDKLTNEALRLMFNKQAVPIKMNTITAYVIKSIMKVGTEEQDDKRSL